MLPHARVLLVAAFLAGAANAQRYVLSELPSNSPYGAVVWDLNDAGTAVGDNLTATLQRHALQWSASGVVDLTPSNPLAQAQGIAENGVVAGWLQNAGTTEATRWNAGVPALLGWLPGHVGSLAQDVNDAGLVCGWSVTPSGDPVAAVWQNGSIQAIGPAQSWAFAVSETGDVVGRRWAGVAIEAFRWRSGTTITLPDLGPDDAQAVGISPLGRASGYARAPNNMLHAVTWDANGTLHDLGPFAGPSGPLPAQANDVNDRGVAVGTAIVDPVAELFLAMVWRDGGPAEDLNTLIQPGTGWTLFEAQAVNARGEIAGVGVRAGASGVRSFLLRPDCDGDGISDLDEIALGTAHDSNGDGIDDRCQHCQGSLGFAGPGAVALSICGDELLAAGTVATLAIEGAPAQAPVVIVVGLVNQPTPLLGGTLVPGGSLLLVTGVAGSNGELAFPVPGLGTFPVTLFVQGMALAGPQAWFSNAVQLVLGL